jgi:hypothetical protein
VISELREKLYSAFRSRRSDYLTTFNGPVADRVLADLAEFCRARETTFHPDERLHAVLEGRREVWLRINKYLNLTDREIQSLIEKKEG